MAWNGAGQFLRAYNWQADRDASIKIMAARMDGEFDNYQGGLNNCLTLDGQNSPSADIPWGGKKITNLATPTLATDAVNKAYVDASQGVLTLEASGTVSWTSASTFTITAINVASRYTPGLRLKIIHNNGATTSYVTVLGAVFGSDTVVTITGATLVSTITSVFYSSLDPVSFIQPVYSSLILGYTQTSPYTSASSNTQQLLFQSIAAARDSLVEWTAGTFRFAPKVSGTYCINAVATLQSFASNITNLSTSGFLLYANGSLAANMGLHAWVYPTGTTTNTLALNVVDYYVGLTAGSYYQFAAQLPTWSSGTVAFTDMSLRLDRLP